MNKRQINNHLKNAVADMTPDIFDKLPQPTLSYNIGGDVIMNTKIKKIPFKLTAIAACAAALTVAASAVVYTNNYMVNSLVSLDVNPSIEIATNKQDKVLKITALNEDAQKVLENMELKNTNVHTAVNAIMGSLIKNGFITPEKNSVLVTVKNDDKQKTQELSETVTEKIDETLSENNVEANVFNLNGEKKGIINQGIAKKFDVSEGKLAFIVTLARLDASLTLEQLSKMTIDELADLIEEKNIDISHIIDLDELRDLDSLDGLINGRPNGKDKGPKDPVNSGSIPVKNEEKNQNKKPDEKPGNSKPDDKANGNSNKPDDKSNDNSNKPDDKTNGNSNKPDDKTNGNSNKPDDKTNGNNQPDNKTNGNSNKPDDNTNGNSNKSDLADNTKQSNQTNGNNNKSDLADNAKQNNQNNGNGTDKSNEKPDNSNKSKGKS